MKPRSRVSLNALRTFEAVARHKSMTAAAKELCVTAGAVSRQIAELQAVLSFDLFHGARHERTITADGQALASTLTKSLDDIDATLLALDEGREKILDVACLSTMAIRWLIPRLHRFREAHPDIDLRLSTDPRRPDRLLNRIDVSILVLAPDDTPGRQDSVLLAEALGPVLAPSLVGQGDTDGPEGLGALPRLITKTRPKAWEEWQAILSSPPIPAKGVYEFEHLSLAIEAAASGLGLCVTPEHLVQDDIASGRLIAPLGFRASGYTYVARAHGRRKRKSDAFIDWMRQDMSAR